MSDEFESLNNKMPDFASVLAQRIANKENTTVGNSSQNSFDPHKLMVDKKTGNYENLPELPKWPEKDLEKLETYCKRMGIIGFSCGRMHPIAALSMLKQQFGEDFSDVPLESRVPVGYEKIGPSGHGPNYPFTQTSNKKQLLRD